MQHKLLLEMEYNCEKEEYRRQSEAVGLQRKVKRGDAWFPVSVGKSYYNSLNQLAVEVLRTQDNEIEHNFEFGRPVAFFEVKKAPSQPPRGEGTDSQGNPGSSPRGGREGASGRQGSIKLLFTGTVSYVDGDRMVVTVPDSAPLTKLQTAEKWIPIIVSMLVFVMPFN